MKKLIKLIVVLLLIQLNSCSKNDELNLNYNNLKTIEIGDYQFEFPSHFKLIEEQGIDSYVGNVVGSGFSLSFDFGYYSGGPNIYIPENTFEIIEDEIENHKRQIFIANNPDLHSTSINFYDLNGYSEEIHSYLALSMGVSKISFEQQELIVKILKSGAPIN